MIVHACIFKQMQPMENGTVFPRPMAWIGSVNGKQMVAFDTPYDEA